jgi:hypothetical protein
MSSVERSTRVARCYIFKKIQTLEGLAMEGDGILYKGLILCFVVIWYIFPVLVCSTKKNLATLRVADALPFCFETCITRTLKSTLTKPVATQTWLWPLCSQVVESGNICVNQYKNLMCSH